MAVDDSIGSRALITSIMFIRTDLISGAFAFHHLTLSLHLGTTDNLSRLLIVWGSFKAKHRLNTEENIFIGKSKRNKEALKNRTTPKFGVAFVDETRLKEGMRKRNSRKSKATISSMEFLEAFEGLHLSAYFTCRLN